MSDSKLNEEKIRRIVEAFADYVDKHYIEPYENEEINGDLISSIIFEHFEEFAEWSKKDQIIDEKEEKYLLSNMREEPGNEIIEEAASELLMILQNRN